MRMIDPILMELEQEAGTTRNILDRLPEDKLTWRPHPKSMTLGHHRGQLSLYLRLLDQSVPSVYGPTADENPFA